MFQQGHCTLLVWVFQTIRYTQSQQLFKNRFIRASSAYSLLEFPRLFEVFHDRPISSENPDKRT